MTLICICPLPDTTYCIYIRLKLHVYIIELLYIHVEEIKDIDVYMGPIQNIYTLVKIW